MAEAKSVNPPKHPSIAPTGRWREYWCCLSCPSAWSQSHVPADGLAVFVTPDIDADPWCRQRQRTSKGRSRDGKVASATKVFAKGLKRTFSSIQKGDNLATVSQVLVPGTMAMGYIYGRELEDLLQRKPRSNFLIVDVRDEERTYDGHICGSIHYPSETFHEELPKLIAETSGKKMVVFHCALSQMRGPSCARAYTEQLEAMEAETERERLQKEREEGERAEQKEREEGERAERERTRKQEEGEELLDINLKTEGAIPARKEGEACGSSMVGPLAAYSASTEENSIVGEQESCPTKDKQATGQMQLQQKRRKTRRNPTVVVLYRGFDGWAYDGRPICHCKDVRCKCQ